jgi:hypothetical protein
MNGKKVNGTRTREFVKHVGRLREKERKGGVCTALLMP